MQVVDSTYFFLGIERLRGARQVYAILFTFLALAMGCHEPCRDVHSDRRNPQAGHLEIGTSGDYPPFSRWSEGAARPEGFSIAVAQAYADERGSSLGWIRFRWSNLAADLRAGRFDVAISGITVRPERSIHGRFSLPLATSGAVVLVALDSPIRSASDLDRPDVTLAVNAGGHLEQVARQLFPTARVEAIVENGQVLDRLVAGTADGVVSDVVEAPLWQRRTPLQLRTIGPLTRDSKAAWFAPDREAEAIDFDRWLLEAERTGRLAGLRRQFGLPTDATARALPALLGRMNERLSLMPAVADAKLLLGKPIEDTAREARVLDAAQLDVEQAAAAMGVTPPDADSVRRLFQAQIEAAKWIQEEHVRKKSRSSPAMNGPELEGVRAELDQSIRPALLYLGNRIAMLIVVNADDPATQFSYEDVARALEEQGLPETHLRALEEALRDVIGTAGPSAPEHRPESATTDTIPRA